MSLRYRVFYKGELLAATHYGEEAAAVVAMRGCGGSIKYDRRVVWREGKETFGAGESYDSCAIVMQDRVGLAEARRRSNQERRILDQLEV